MYRSLHGNGPVQRRPRLPSKTDPYMATTVAKVKVVFGQVLDGNALISASPGIKTMFLIVSNNLYQLLPFFLSFQVQQLRKKAIYTDGYQSILNVKIWGNFD